MNNIKLRILEHANANPWITRGGLVDALGGRDRTEKDVRELVAQGYLLDNGNMELTEKGYACINSASFRNRTRRIGKCVSAIILSVISVVTGNWLWDLLQSAL